MFILNESILFVYTYQSDIPKEQEEFDKMKMMVIMVNTTLAHTSNSIGVIARSLGYCGPSQRLIS